jgi:hypothetical protein
MAVFTVLRSAKGQLSVNAPPQSKISHHTRFPVLATLTFTEALGNHREIWQCRQSQPLVLLRGKFNVPSVQLGLDITFKLFKSCHVLL